MWGETGSCLSAVWGICIFIPLNKTEMRSTAPKPLLCDRNRIIDWHTESCPSNSPRRARAASDENKGRLERARLCGKLCLFASLFHSLCLSAALSLSPQRLGATAEGIVVGNTKRESNSLAPSTADVVCVCMNGESYVA